MKVKIEIEIDLDRDSTVSELYADLHDEFENWGDIVQLSVEEVED